MARIVQKFGGTSVADVARIKNVARRVKPEVDSGNEVAVVVSAMAGATDQLVDWTRDTSRLHDARTGEIETVGGLAGLEEGVGILGGAAHHGPVGREGALAVSAH